jgi:heterodisulfide reductase subunit C
MKNVNFEFRHRLNKMLGGFSHNYCYQCGACVADCPAHRFLPEFNPRTIILKALYGLEEDLIGADSLIWNCTNCYNCYERCPQAVNPIEVIITLKNMSRSGKTSPAVINNIRERVLTTGLTVTPTDHIRKRRRELNLPEFKADCLEDMKILLKHH